MDEYFLPKQLSIILRIIYGVCLYWLISFIPFIMFGGLPGHFIRLVLIAFLIWLTKKILCSKPATIIVGCLIAVAVIWLCLNKSTTLTEESKTEVHSFEELYEIYGRPESLSGPTVPPDEIRKIREQFYGTPDPTVSPETVKKFINLLLPSRQE